MALIYI